LVLYLLLILKNKNMNKKFSRKRNIRKPYKWIYIFTEGQKTEPIYFEAKKKEIRKNNIKIEITGTARNTLDLVNFALDFVREEKVDLNEDDCWVVFDKDSFKKDFDNSIEKAESNGLKVAYSNECFELWLLLHFDFLNSAIGRKEYSKKLTRKLEKKYSKNFNIYPFIKDKETNAIKNTRKLLKQFENENSCFKKNPSTTVHLLVESLNELKNNN